jgi:hypothetical protein
MKRTTTSLFAIAVLAAVTTLAPTAKYHLSVLPVAHAQSAQSAEEPGASGECGCARLSGYYGFTFSGFELQSGQSVPFSGEGVGHFSGAHRFAAIFALSYNGGPANGGSYTSSTGNPYTATYKLTPTVLPDGTVSCTGLFTATSGSGGDNFAFVVVRDGAEILATAIGPSGPSADTLALDLKKQ